MAAQRAERTKVLRKQTTGRTKNYLTNRWDTEKLNISLKTGGPKKFWEDQRAWTKDLLGGPKTFWSAVGGPKRILRTGD